MSERPDPWRWFAMGAVPGLVLAALAAFAPLSNDLSAASLVFTANLPDAIRKLIVGIGVLGPYWCAGMVAHAVVVSQLAGNQRMFRIPAAVLLSAHCATVISVAAILASESIKAEEYVAVVVMLVAALPVGFCTAGALLSPGWRGYGLLVAAAWFACALSPSTAIHGLNIVGQRPEWLGASLWAFALAATALPAVLLGLVAALLGRSDAAADPRGDPHTDPPVDW